MSALPVPAQMFPTAWRAPDAGNLGNSYLTLITFVIPETRTLLSSSSGKWAGPHRLFFLHCLIPVLGSFQLVFFMVFVWFYGFFLLVFKDCFKLKKCSD